MVLVFLTSERIVGRVLSRLPDHVVFPWNDAANRYRPDRPAAVGQGAERNLGRIMPTTMAKA